MLSIVEATDKVKRGLAAGATVVDMEASAIMAWTQFRQAKVYQFFFIRLIMLTITIMSGMQDMKKRKADAMTFFENSLSNC